MQAWDRFLQERVKELGEATVDRWLRSLHVARYDACNIYLEANDSFQMLWFEEHIRPKLKSLVNNNNSPVRVHLTLKGEKKSASRSIGGKKQKTPLEGPFQIGFEELLPYCTFEEFIPSHDNLVPYKLVEEVCNRMALQKVQAAPSLSSLPQASLIPKDIINPIYLYGPSGSGKTHLLMACAAKLMKMGYRALYCKASLFTDHVVRAMRAAEMAKFREVYRKADVLIIDDVHILAKKSATQEEFFHTFNTLHTAGKQIILSALTTPQNLQYIEPRLISRFEWGCSLPLSPLSKKETSQLIQQRASFYQAILAEPTVDFLIETFPHNNKSLMTALEALILRSQLGNKLTLEKRPLSLQAAKVLLKDLIEREKSVALTPQRIIDAVAEFYGITSEDILGKSQSRECVLPRQVSMYICRSALKMPYMKIGDLFSRDHSTVMSSIKLVEKQISSVSSDLARAVNAVEIALTTQQAGASTQK